MKALRVVLIFVATSLASDPEVFKPFIVGGTDAEPEQFPFLASMRMTVNRAHACGGAIINARWILTAAHCITALNIVRPDQFYNVVGTVSRTSEEGDHYETERYLLYPEWSQATNRHDVALVETIEYINFGAMVMPLGVLPDRDGGEVEATIVGFGQTNVVPRTDVKQFLEQTSMTNADCRRHFRYNPFNAMRIFESNICFISPKGTSVCGGDSGGSIVVNMSGKFISVGIASWGVAGCGQADPDVYARTSFYYSWIKNVTEINRIEE